jgi:ABC-type multidrug transport system fused ATPase/permease subunit
VLELIKTCFKIRAIRKQLLVVVVMMILMSVAEQLEILWVAMLTSVGQDLGVLNGGAIGKVTSWIGASFFNSDNVLQTLLIISLPVTIFKGLTLYWGRFSAQKLSIDASRELRDLYFAHLQKLPMQFFQQHHIGSLSQKVTGDSQQIALSINAYVKNLILTPFKLFSSVIFCIYLSWKLSLVIVVGFPLLVLPIVILTKKVRLSTKQLMKNQEQFSSTLLDYLSGMQTVKIFSMESFSFLKYKEQNLQMAKLEKKAAKYDLMTRPILHAVTTLCLAGIVLSGLYIFQMSIPDLIAFCGILHLTYEPIKRFSDENASIQRGVAALERMLLVMNEPIQEDSKEGVDLNHFNDSIEFKNVSFKYNDELVLKNVSFKIQKGESVAIVGATGSGKSTILNLIPRLYELQEGDIFIDGVSIRCYKQHSLRKLISFVSQKPFLFYDTIQKNISLGNDVPQEQIERAAQQAFADEFIDKFKDRYETHLNEAGKNLSGGQQQRIALARALAKQSPILLLDEATSQLDSYSEDKVKRAIESMKGQLTQIIVAHRLKTIESVDKVLFMKEGEIVAAGDLQSLYTSCPDFKMMWDLNDLKVQKS